MQGPKVLLPKTGVNVETFLALAPYIGSDEFQLTNGMIKPCEDEFLSTVSDLEPGDHIVGWGGVVSVWPSPDGKTYRISGGDGMRLVLGADMQVLVRKFYDTADGEPLPVEVVLMDDVEPDPDVFHEERNWDDDDDDADSAVFS